MATDTNLALAFIAGEFAKHGIKPVKDGEKFVRLQPVGWSNAPPEQFLARLTRPSPGSADIPPGFIHWLSVDLNQILATYSDVSHRTILRSPNLICVTRFRNRTPLTRDEFAYAIRALFALNDVAIIDDGDKFAQVVPLATASQIQTRAPAPAKGERLIDPGKIPTFRNSPVALSVKPPPPKPTPAQQVKATLSRLYLRARTAIFGPPATPPKPEADNLVAYYAQLKKAKAIPSKRFGKRPIYFEIKIPLTKTELLYAIEATLAQDNLAIIAVPPNSYQLVHRSEVPGVITNSPALPKR